MAASSDPRYITLIERLKQIRKAKGIQQQDLAKSLKLPQSTISKIESVDRLINVFELADWLSALGYDHRKFLEETSWLTATPNTSVPAIPIPGAAIDYTQDGIDGVLIDMAWQGQTRQVFIAQLTANDYVKLEEKISATYAKLNDGTAVKNREAIKDALIASIEGFPEANPSDLYHHVVYRLYLREYTRTQADRSWVRAGGEALEDFLVEHYNKILKPHKIELEWLSNEAKKKAALSEMRIHNKVGGSKLDIALYGTTKDGKRRIFGGIHVKASLAERVSDDVPCSEAMLKKKMVSYLMTLDAKSFPPPNGDLVNRGELGSPTAPSDKRNYIELHGSFSACFSYNTRTMASPSKGAHKAAIYSSTFDPAEDAFPKAVKDAWNAYQATIKK